MVQTSRIVWKPECISAVALRAQALARRSAGQTPGLSSATYSVMASESQTVRSPSVKQGTLPVGENVLRPVPFAEFPKGTRRSSKGMFRAFSKSHGRSDHEE